MRVIDIEHLRIGNYTPPPRPVRSKWVYILYTRASASRDRMRFGAKICQELRKVRSSLSNARRSKINSITRRSIKSQRARYMYDQRREKASIWIPCGVDQCQCAWAAKWIAIYSLFIVVVLIRFMFINLCSTIARNNNEKRFISLIDWRYFPVENHLTQWATCLRWSYSGKPF